MIETNKFRMQKAGVNQIYPPPEIPSTRRKWSMVPEYLQYEPYSCFHTPVLYAFNNCTKWPTLAWRYPALPSISVDVDVDEITTYLHLPHFLISFLQLYKYGHFKSIFKFYIQCRMSSNKMKQLYIFTFV